MHQSPDMRQERESAKLAREQLVPAVGQRARRKPMGQPARLVSMVVLKALAQQVPVSTQSVRLTMRPALVQTQPVRCLQTLHMPGKIVPAYQLYFPQWPQYAIVCLSPSNRLDCHRFNVTLQHYASASPYA